jgi:hypothetical protein
MGGVWHVLDILGSSYIVWIEYDHEGGNSTIVT